MVFTLIYFYPPLVLLIYKKNNIDKYGVQLNQRCSASNISFILLDFLY